MAEASNYGAMEAGEVEEQGYSVMEPHASTPAAPRNYRRFGVAAVLGLAAVAGAGVTAWSYGKDATGVTQLDAAIAAPNSAGVGNSNDAPAFGRAPAGTETSESPVGDQGSNPAYGTTNHIEADSPESNVADPDPYVPVEEDVEERATPGSTKKDHKEHNSDYDRGTPGKTEESPAGTTGSNPIDGMDGGEASTTPEMGSADNTPTEEDVEERATPGSTKKDHKEHNSDYDRGTPGKTEESPAGTTGSNPIDGMDGGEASTTPEMGSADNTPTEEDVELVGTKPNSSGVGQGPEARAPEGTATGESAPGDEGSNPALSGGHQTPESDSPEANAEPAEPAVAP